MYDSSIRYSIIDYREDEMMSKKFGSKAIAVCLLAGTLSMGTAFAANTDETRVIPYPAGLDTETEGASSAPTEINHADSLYFKHLDIYEMETISGRRLVLSHYPTYQQTREYTCGPAAALTVLYRYGNKDYDEMSMTKAMKTQGYPTGTSLKNMVNFFRDIGWNVKSGLNTDKFSRFEDFRAFLMEQLSNGHPILVENVEWGGHWRVIIGYDNMETESPLDDMLIFADPYDTGDHYQDGYTVGNAIKFFSMWFDHSMLPKKERYQPWIVAYPK